MRIQGTKHDPTGVQFSVTHPDKVCELFRRSPALQIQMLVLLSKLASKVCRIRASSFLQEVSLEGETPDYVAISSEIGYTSHDIGMDATTPALCDVLVYDDPIGRTKV